jgi:hypothetical protein
MAQQLPWCSQVQGAGTIGPNRRRSTALQTLHRLSLYYHPIFPLSPSLPSISHIGFKLLLVTVLYLSLCLNALPYISLSQLYDYLLHLVSCLVSHPKTYVTEHGLY